MPTISPVNSTSESFLLVSSTDKIASFLVFTDLTAKFSLIVANKSIAESSAKELSTATIYP